MFFVFFDRHVSFACVCVCRFVFCLTLITRNHLNGLVRPKRENVERKERCLHPTLAFGASCGGDLRGKETPIILLCYVSIICITDRPHYVYTVML